MMENKYFAYASLIGMGQGVFVPIPWCNVHQIALLHHGILLAQGFWLVGVPWRNTCTEQTLSHAQPGGLCYPTCLSPACSTACRAMHLCVWS